MDGQVIVWGLTLALVLDVAMVVFAWRYIARLRERSGQTRAGYSGYELLDDQDFDSLHSGGDLSFDHDDEVFDSVDSVGDSHHPLVNPATGLPMLDGFWVDVAGNPYGTDLTDCSGSSHFDSACGAFDDFSGSSDFDSGCGGLDDFSGSSDFGSGWSGNDW